MDKILKQQNQFINSIFNHCVLIRLKYANRNV